MASVFLKTSAFIIALLSLCGADARTVRAQEQRGVAATSASATPAAERRPASRQAAPTEEADLSITANVTARELRFDVVPDVKVEFPGKPERNTVWEAERQNLPRPVQPGVTYRDIGVQLKITSVFADIDRIVAEALGEVPVTDDAPQSVPQPATVPAPQDAPPPSATATPAAEQPSEGKPL